MGLRPILALLKSLLTLIRLRRRLKPFNRLCAFLPGIYKLRVGLELVFFGFVNTLAGEEEKGRRRSEKRRVKRKEKERRRERREKRGRF